MTEKRPRKRKPLEFWVVRDSIGIIEPLWSTRREALRYSLRFHSVKRLRQTVALFREVLPKKVRRGK